MGPVAGALPIGQNLPIPQESGIKRFFRKVGEILLVALKAIACFLLTYLNPVVFAFSIGAGVLYDQEATRIIHRIEEVIARQKILTALFMAVGGFFALPVTLGAASMYAGLKVGLWIGRE